MQKIKISQRNRQVIFLLAGIFCGATVSLIFSYFLSMQSIVPDFLNRVIIALPLTILFSFGAILLFNYYIENLSPGRTLFASFNMLILLNLFVIYQYSGGSLKMTPDLGLAVSFVDILILTLIVKTQNEIFKSRFHDFALFTSENGYFGGLIIGWILAVLLAFSSNVKFIQIFSLGSLGLAAICNYLLLISGEELKLNYFNLLEARALTEWKSILKNRYTRLVFVFSIVSEFILGGMILIAIYQINKNYTWYVPPIAQISFTGITAYFIGVLLMLLFSESIFKKSANIQTYLLSPLVIAILLIASIVVYKYLPVEPYKDLLIAPIELSFIYLAIAGYIILQKYIFHTIYQNFFDVIDIRIRTYLSIKITWVARITAIFICFLLTLFIPAIGFVGACLVIIICLFVFVFYIFLVRKVYKRMLDEMLRAIRKQEDFDYYLRMINEFKSLKIENSKLYRIWSLLQTLHPVLLRTQLRDFINSENHVAQLLALEASLNSQQIDILPLLENIFVSSGFQVSSNASKIIAVRNELLIIKDRCENTKYIKDLAGSIHPTERIACAFLLEFTDDNLRAQLFKKLLFDESSEVVNAAIISSRCFTDTEIIRIVIQKLNLPDHTISVLSSIVLSGDVFLTELEKVFNLAGQSELIKLLIIKAYQEIGTDYAKELIIRKIDNTNRNIMFAVFNAMNVLGIELPKRFEYVIENEIEDLCNQMARLLMIKNSLGVAVNKEENLLHDAIRFQIESLEDRMFVLLGVLFNAASIEQIRTQRQSRNFDMIIFSNQILDSVIPDLFALKPVIMILFSDAQTEYKLSKLAGFLPVQTYKVEEIAHIILSESPGIANNWTKVCLLNLVMKTKFVDTKMDYIISNLSNDNAIVQEACIKLLNSQNFNQLNEIAQRFNFDLNEQLNSNKLETAFLIYNKSVTFHDLNGESILKLLEISTMENISSDKDICVPAPEVFIPFNCSVEVLTSYSGRQFMKEGYLFFNHSPKDHKIHYQVVHWAENACLLKFDKTEFCKILLISNKILDCMLI